MPSPFPGMDPYLEDPNHWGNVHHGFISTSQAMLNARLRPHYFAQVEERVYICPPDDPSLELFRVPDIQIIRGRSRGRKRGNGSSNGRTVATMPVETRTLFPEEEVHEYYLRIADAVTKDVVAVIEFLSPSNKAPGSVGRAEYMKKRQQVLDTSTHWVEIDLLRAGAPITDRWAVEYDYMVHVSRSELRPKGWIWPILVRDPLPVVKIPLRGKSESAPLDLQAVLNTAYDRGAFDALIDYRRASVPPLRPSDAAWADKLLRKAGLRRARRSR